MKALMTAAAAAALLVPAGLAEAQPLSPTTFAPTTFYGTLGYAGTNVEGADLGAVQGRLGVRFGKYVGAEGELGIGAQDDDVTVGGVPLEVDLRHQEAAYGVVFAPISPNLDLFARGGYGHSEYSVQGAGLGTLNGGSDSWNYGLGGQYFIDGRNGVRIDWTRHDFSGAGAADNADVWSVGYSRRF